MFPFGVFCQLAVFVCPLGNENQASAFNSKCLSVVFRASEKQDSRPTAQPGRCCVPRVGKANSSCPELDAMRPTRVFRASEKQDSRPYGSNKKGQPYGLVFFVGGATRNRTGDEGFADPCLTAWLLRRKKRDNGSEVDCGIPYLLFWSGLRGSNPPPRPWQGRALPNELNPHGDFFFFCPARHGDAAPARECLPRHKKPLRFLMAGLVPSVRIEPTTQGFSVPCSTN